MTLAEALEVFEWASSTPRRSSGQPTALYCIQTEQSRVEETNAMQHIDGSQPTALYCIQTAQSSVEETNAMQHIDDSQTGCT